MSEYKVGLRELSEYWTRSRTLLYLRKIGERYEKQKKHRKGEKTAKAMTEGELVKSDFMRG